MDIEKMSPEEIKKFLEEKAESSAEGSHYVTLEQLTKSEEFNRNSSNPLFSRERHIRITGYLDRKSQLDEEVKKNG